MAKTKVDIFSGFLGAGKTTLIKKLIKEAYAGQNIVLIENEFGEIAVDGGFLQDAGIKITEMSSGCICCSLVGDFGRALKQVISDYHPDRILIEPSGVGKLSDVIKAVMRADSEDLEIDAATAVVDAKKAKMYMKNFGEFFNDQIENAGAIILSRTDSVSEEKLSEVVSLLREHNATCQIITTPWNMLSGKQICDAIEKNDTLETEMEKLKATLSDDDDDDEDEHEHHHHHDDDDEDEHEHHHHHDDDDEDEHEHHHHHHHHHHDGDHDADEIFVSWGEETTKKFTEDEIKDILSKLDDKDKYGLVLRAKGIVESQDGKWIHFDHVPGEQDVRNGSAAVTGRLCVIGSALKDDNLKELFGI